MDYKLLLDTAVLAGEIMLRNGAEIFRVESTIRHILRVSGLKTSQAYVTLTGIMVTLDDPTMDSLTVVRRIENRGSNLNKVHKVNTISREFCQGKITLEEAFRQIKHIDDEKMSRRTLAFAYVICTGAFAFLFGGGILEAIFAALNGFVLYLILLLLDNVNMNQFLKLFLASMVMAIFAVLCTKIPRITFTIDPVIVSGIMPIVPGAAITNAIRDTLQGDYTAGGAKSLEAFVIATAIALGVGCGLAFIGGGL